MLLLFLLITGLVQAPASQEKSMEFGVLKPGTLGRTVYEPDTSASAVVLHEQMSVFFGSYFQLYKRHHVRIQILKKEGADYATIVYPYEESEYNLEEIVEKKAAVYFLDQAGRPQTRTLQSRDFRVEKVTRDRRNLRFAFPNAVPGSVIEYMFTVKVPALLRFNEYVFHRDIPVVTSYLRLEIPDYFSYEIREQGTMTFSLDSRKTIEQVFEFGYQGRRVVQNLPVTLSEWVLNDIQVIKPEPYAPALRDFRHKLQFQLVSFGITGSVEHVARDWRTVATWLNKDAQFGGRWKAKPKEAARNARARSTGGDIGYIQQIVASVRDSIRWNGRYTFWADDPERVFLKNRSGASGDINTRLLALLREAGFDARPVLLSTRDHGLVNLQFNSYDQFNHVIARVEAEGRTLFLDATEPFAPFGHLPESCAVSTGLMIAENGDVAEVQLPAPARDFRRIGVDVTVHPDGTFAGSATVRTAGLILQSDWHTLKTGSEVEDALGALFFSAESGVRVTGVEVLSEAVKDTLVYRFTFTTADAGTVAGGAVLMPAGLVQPHGGHPFTAAVRKLPVDFSNRYNAAVSMRVKVPEGWKADALPAPVEIKSSGDLLYSRTVSPAPDGYVVMETFNRRKTRFNLPEFAGLKKFYDDIALRQGDMILFQF